MAVIARTQVLEDGPRNYVVRLSASLQAGDAETFVKKIDVSALPKQQGRACRALSLLKLDSSTVNASFALLWEAVSPANNTTLWRFPMNFSDKQSFVKIGGIQNNATGLTGNVLLSTENWGDPQLDGSYDITLWFRKKY